MALLLLGGCGFQPLYGKRADMKSVDEQMTDVRIQPIEDRRGQIVRNVLVTRLNPYGEPAKPGYTLAVKLAESISGLGIQKNSYATLGELSISATFVLAPQDSSKQAISGTSYSLVSVNFLGPRYASIAAERDAETRALEDLADDISSQVTAYLNNPASKPAINRSQEEILSTPQAPQLPSTGMFGP